MHFSKSNSDGPFWGSSDSTLVWTTFHLHDASPLACHPKPHAKHGRNSHPRNPTSETPKSHPHPADTATLPGTKKSEKVGSERQSQGADRRLRHPPESGQGFGRLKKQGPRHESARPPKNPHQRLRKKFIPAQAARRNRPRKASARSRMDRKKSDPYMI